MGLAGIGHRRIYPYNLYSSERRHVRGLIPKKKKTMQERNDDMAIMNDPPLGKVHSC